MPQNGAVVVPPPVITQPNPLLNKEPEVEPEEADPEEVSFRDLLTGGDLKFRAGEFGEALSLFQQALQARPGSPAALSAIAQCQFALGEYGRAAMAMYEAIRRWPDLIDMSREIRTCYPSGEKFEELMHLLDSHVEWYDDDVRGLFLAGVMHCLNGNEERAGELFRSALELRPHDPVLLAQAQRFGDTEVTIDSEDRDDAPPAQPLAEEE